MMNYGPKLHARIFREKSLKIYHRFALFDVPEMGNFMTPRGNTLQLDVSFGVPTGASFKLASTEATT